MTVWSRPPQKCGPDWAKFVRLESHLSPQKTSGRQAAWPVCCSHCPPFKGSQLVHCWVPEGARTGAQEADSPNPKNHNEGRTFAHKYKTFRNMKTNCPVGGIGAVHDKPSEHLLCLRNTVRTVAEITMSFPHQSRKKHLRTLLGAHLVLILTH